MRYREGGSLVVLGFSRQDGSLALIRSERVELVKLSISLPLVRPRSLGIKCGGNEVIERERRETQASTNNC